MKWTTRAEDAHTAHWIGFKASERTTVPCNPNCKTFVKNGQKYITHYCPSGTRVEIVEETPAATESRKLPQGERGTYRRGQKKGGA